MENSGTAGSTRVESATVEAGGPIPVDPERPSEDASERPQPRTTIADLAAALNRKALAIAIAALVAWALFRGVWFILPAARRESLPIDLYWIGWGVWVCLGGVVLATALYVVVLGIGALGPSTAHRRRFVAWFAFLVVVLAAANFFTAYRISAIGLHAAALGMTSTSQQALGTLLKFYPATPTLPVHVAHFLGVSGDHLPYDGSAWSSVATALVVASVIVLAAGLVMGQLRGYTPVLALLLLIVSGAYVLVVQTGVVRLDRSLVEFYPIVTSVLPGSSLLVLVVALYAIARTIGTREPGPTLPPGSGTVFVLLLVFLPLAADFENVHALERNVHTILARGDGDGKEPHTPATAAAETMMVTAIKLNVRSGPGVEFPVVTTLVQGNPVTVQERSDGWTRVGANQWVNHKFLGPWR